jgi:predicted dienelactone hydrolase
MRRFICAFLGIWMACMALRFDVRAEALEAGFVDLTLIDPVEGGPMPAIVVYPSNSRAETTRLGPFTMSAGREATPAPGPYPLIVFSHGTGGTSAITTA